MTSTLAFIAAMKLEALRSQRDVLDGEYRDILAAVESAASAADRLRALHDGLGELRLAGDPVHPDLADVSATLDTLTFAAADEIEQWERRLMTELERGRSRSEAVYAFGALLEDGSGDRPKAPNASSLPAYLEALTAEPGAEPAALAPGGLLDQLFDAEGFAGLVARVEERFAGDFAAEVDLHLICGRLIADRERDAGLRDEARSFHDEMSERFVALRDALEISLAEPSDWRWPERALEMRAVATADRIRFHPELELVELVVLEQLALWLERALPTMRTGHVNRRRRLDRLLELNAPEIIIANERHLIDGEIGLLNDRRVLDPDTSPLSVAAFRDIALAGLWSAGLVTGSHYQGYASDSAQLVRLIGAELAIHRATERPFYVVRADIADCFATLDHRVILSMVDRLGVPAAYRALIERYLSAELAAAGDRRPTRRGVLLGLSLSRLLADLVLDAIELGVQRAGVSTARVVDDFMLWSDDPDAVARGYAALVEAIASLGLSIQPSKTGAVAIGGELPAGLPEAPVRFNLLTLEPGGFALEEQAFARLLAVTRSEMESAPSVLAAVRAYNSQARFVVDALVPHPDLPSAAGDHLTTCGAAIQRFAGAAVAGGVESWLRSQIEQRCELERPMPRAWLYWPVSAGGLGLHDAMLELGSIPTGRQKIPDEPYDELANTVWGRWYHHLTEPVPGKPPRESAVSKAQMEDFIARGGELRGSAQDGLGVYWKWVLAVHGPEILERFGTFRFLLRKLVPLDLLSSK